MTTGDARRDMSAAIICRGCTEWRAARNGAGRRDDTMIAIDADRTLYVANGGKQ